MPIYLKFGSIKGNVTEDSHKEWINLESVQFGVGRGISLAAGAGKDREASAPSFSELTISKQMDQSSPYIFQECCVGGKGLDAEFHFVRTSGTKLETYLEVKLEKALVSGYSMSSGGDRPSESVSLNYTKIITKYIPFKEDSSKEAPHPVGYDLMLAKKV